MVSIMSHCLLLSSHSWTELRIKPWPLPPVLTPHELSDGGGAGLPPPLRWSGPRGGEIPLPPPVCPDPAGLSSPGSGH